MDCFTRIFKDEDKLYSPPIQDCRNRWGLGAMLPTYFDRSVNPIPTGAGGGRLCTSPLRIFRPSYGPAIVIVASLELKIDRPYWEIFCPSWDCHQCHIWPLINKVISKMSTNTVEDRASLCPKLFCTTDFWIFRMFFVLICKLNEYLAKTKIQRNKKGRSQTIFILIHT